MEPALFDPVSIMRSGDVGSPSWQHMSICRFVYQYTTATPDIDGSLAGWYDFVPHMLQKGQSRECFEAALTAIACATIAGQTKSDVVSVNARRNYSYAIKVISKTLADPIAALSDDVFASVMLVGFYENLAGDGDQIMGSHLSGLRALVNLRGPSQVRTSLGKDLYFHALSMLQVYEASSGDRTVTADRQRVGTVTPRDGLSGVYWLAYRINTYCANFRKLNKATSITHLEQTVAEGLSLQEELESWYEALPNERRPRRCRCPRSFLYENGSHIYTFASFSIARGWLVYCRCTISLNETLYLCLAILHHLRKVFCMEVWGRCDTDIRLEGCKSRVGAAIDNICASIPSLLEDVDVNGNPAGDSHARKAVKAMVSMWFIWIAKSSAFATSAQKAQACRALERLEGIWGIKEAKKLVDRKRDLSNGVLLAE